MEGPGTGSGGVSLCRIVNAICANGPKARGDEPHANLRAACCERKVVVTRDDDEEDRGAPRHQGQGIRRKVPALQRL